MKKPPTLSLVFLKCAPGRIDIPDDFSEFEDLLQRTIEIGRNRWPQLALPDELFVSYLAQRLPKARAEVPLEQVFEDKYLDDLYLACACMHGVPGAILALEQHCVMGLRTALRQPPHVVDEVCQNVRIHLLVGRTEAGPQLPAYKGKGSLPRWVRVMAVNILLEEQATPVTEKGDEQVMAALEKLPAPGLGAELALIKHGGLCAFQKALREAFTALPAEQRNLLRFYFKDRLTTTELGRVYRKDQSTMSRWLRDTRLRIYEDTKERLSLSTRGFESLLDLILSQLDLNLSLLLREEAQNDDKEKDEEEDEDDLPPELLTAPPEPSPAPGTSSPPQ